MFENNFTCHPHVTNARPLAVKVLTAYARSISRQNRVQTALLSLYRTLSLPHATHQNKRPHVRAISPQPPYVRSSPFAPRTFQNPFSAHSTDVNKRARAVCVIS